MNRNNLALFVLAVTVCVGLTIGLFFASPLKETPKEFVIVKKSKMWNNVFPKSYMSYYFFYSENRFVEVNQEDYFYYQVGDYFIKNYTILH